jgi:hypothetical protein
MNTYDVEVRRQGQLVATVRTNADSGLEACDRAERKMKARPKACHLGENGKTRIVYWAGFDTCARQVIGA